MNEASEATKMSFGAKLILAVSGTLVGIVATMIVFLLSQSFDWNQWRGKVDLRQDSMEKRVDRLEARWAIDIAEIKTLIREIRNEVRLKADKP